MVYGDYSVIVRYQIPGGQLKSVGTQASRVNAVISDLQKQGYQISAIESEGGQTGGVKSAVKNKDTTTIYQQGTPIGKELETPVAQQSLQNTMTIPGGNIPNVYQKVPVEAIPETHQSIINKEYSQMNPVEAVVRNALAISFSTIPRTLEGIATDVSDFLHGKESTHAALEAYIAPGEQLQKTGSLATPSKSVAEWEYGIQTEPNFALRVVKVASPIIETVVLPLAFTEIAGIIGAATIESSGTTLGTVLNVGSKVTQYAVLPAAIGTEAGVTAAVTGGFASKESIKMDIMTIEQFGVMGAAYKYVDVGEFDRFSNKVSNSYETFKDITPMRQINMQIEEFKLDNEGIGFAKGMYNVEEEYAWFGTKPSALSSFKIKAIGAMETVKSVFDMETYAAVRQVYPNESLQMFSQNIVGSSREAISLEQLSSQTIYDVEANRWLEYTPTKLESFQEEMFARKLNIFRLGAVTNQNIKTQTVVFSMQGSPESLFFSLEPNKNILSVGRISPKGNEAEITGMTYWKLSEENVFFQETPFSGKVSIDYLGRTKGIDITTTGKKIFTSFGEANLENTDYETYKILGKSMKGKEITLPTLDEAGNWVIEKYYYPESEVKSVGLSLSKNIGIKSFFNPEEIVSIKKTYEVDISASKGYYKESFGAIGGTFEDKTIRLMPKVQSKEYYGSNMGFDTTGIVKLSMNDIILPGGISGTQSLEGPPRLIEPMYSTKNIIYEETEPDIISSYWSGKVSKSENLSMQITANIQELSFESILSKMNLQQNLSITNQMNTQSQRQIQLQRQEQIQTPVHLQLQQQFQLQLQAQTTLQTTMQIQVPVNLQIEVPMNVPNIPDITLDENIVLIPSIPPIKSKTKREDIFDMKLPKMEDWKFRHKEFPVTASLKMLKLPKVKI